MIPATKLAWFAAIVDLKGTIVNKANQTRATQQTVLVVNSKDFAVVEAMAAMTGTKPEPRAGRKAQDFMRRGCVDHCPEAHVHMEYPWALPPSMTWTITGLAGGVVLYNILPYMVNRAKFRPMMEQTFGDAVLAGRGSGATRAAVRRLAALGWEVPRPIAAKLLTEADVKAAPRKPLQPA